MIFFQPNASSVRQRYVHIVFAWIQKHKKKMKKRKNYFAHEKLLISMLENEES